MSLKWINTQQWHTFSVTTPGSPRMEPQHPARPSTNIRRSCNIAELHFVLSRDSNPRHPNREIRLFVWRVHIFDIMTNVCICLFPWQALNSHSASAQFRHPVYVENKQFCEIVFLATILYSWHWPSESMSTAFHRIYRNQWGHQLWHTGSRNMNIQRGRWWLSFETRWPRRVRFKCFASVLRLIADSLTWWKNLFPISCYISNVASTWPDLFLVLTNPYIAALELIVFHKHIHICNKYSWNFVLYICQFTPDSRVPLIN